MSEESPGHWLERLSGLDATLEARCPGRWAKVERLPAVDSTNSRLLARMDLVPDRYHVCTAFRQTEGRGRRGRTWLSEGDGGLVVSIGRALAVGESTAPTLTLAVGVGVARGLTECGFGGFGLKWPNDLVRVDGAKLGGVLVETRAGVAGAEGARVRPALVVGVGINRSGAAALDVGQPAADLASLPGPGPVPPADLLTAVLGGIADAWDAHAAAGLAPFITEFGRLDRLRGRTIEIVDTGLRGIADGIDLEDGALFVLSGGRRLRVYSGDVSVRLSSNG